MALTVTSVLLAFMQRAISSMRLLRCPASAFSTVLYPLLLRFRYLNFSTRHLPALPLLRLPLNTVTLY